jgi:hypothetical protein
MLAMLLQNCYLSSMAALKLHMRLFAMKLAVDLMTGLLRS